MLDLCAESAYTCLPVWLSLTKGESTFDKEKKLCCQMEINFLLELYALFLRPCFTSRTFRSPCVNMTRLFQTYNFGSLHRSWYVCRPNFSDLVSVSHCRDSQFEISSRSGWTSRRAWPISRPSDSCTETSPPGTACKYWQNCGRSL